MIPYWMKYNYLQVNDWPTYLGFLFLADGIPLALIGMAIGFVIAKFWNRIVSR